MLCLMGATVSAVRLERTVRELKLVESAADELNRFLSLVAEQPHDEELKELVRINEQVELEHVTLQDSNGRKLLEDVSVVFKPGQLIGVVASQPLQAHALVELLMGFGRPVSGRMLVDGDLIANLKSHSLTNCAHWVASDGAIVTGSVLENLRKTTGAVGDEALHAALTAARLKMAIQKLPDETLTLITPDDDRLSADEAFRIGLARAALRGASVVVVEEPELRAEAEVEEESLEAICSLVNPQTITIVLPQRLLTLRQCDVVIMLHNHRIADAGRHAELLQRNELYRHLNYLRFNPFRGS
jgi:ABC-type transport system involved in cytochrome bd biosynthesis fused ATPase/permease subunit